MKDVPRLLCDLIADTNFLLCRTRDKHREWTKSQSDFRERLDIYDILTLCKSEAILMSRILLYFDEYRHYRDLTVAPNDSRFVEF